MINLQNKFTDTEAQAIVDMIQRLVSDDYAVSIDNGGIQKDDYGNKRVLWLVSVVDTDGSEAASAKSFLLHEAISDAYVQTPEGKNR